MSLQVRDLMTKNVFIIAPDTDFKAIARLLDDHQVNLLPVLDAEQRVVGVVSEADLLAKVEWQGKGRPGRIERWLLLEDDLRKAEGRLASEVMTRNVATIGPRATVSAAAHMMRVNHVKAVPVVDEEGRLVGILSRTDMLKSFTRDDDLIQAEVAGEVLRDALSIGPDSVGVAVKDGAVTLSGEVESLSLCEIITRRVGAVPGVVGVVNEIAYRLDDHHVQATPEPADNLTYAGPPLR